MSEQVAKAMERVRSVFARHPSAAVHSDEPATARWEQGLGVVSFHENGTQIPTDMPVELGGRGDQVTPGWLLRAALASCLATRIAMEAAATGVTLSRIEVLARGTSDARGLLGMSDPGGKKVSAGPLELQLEVKIGTRDATREQVEAMVLKSVGCSPVSATIGGGLQVGLRIDVEPN